MFLRCGGQGQLCRRGHARHSVAPQPQAWPSAQGPRVVSVGAAATGLLLGLGGANSGSGFPRMIQEEKESTELRAEEIETRVTSGSMEALNLTQLRKRGSIPTSLTALSLASASPPLSGRSTPKLTSRSAAQDLDRMGVMTLVRVLGQLMSGPVMAGLCVGGWPRGAAKAGEGSLPLSWGWHLLPMMCADPGMSGHQHVLLGLERACHVFLSPLSWISTECVRNSPPAHTSPFPPEVALTYFIRPAFFLLSYSLKACVRH